MRWSPPMVGTYKANLDVALFDGLDHVGIGVVFRDHSSHVIISLSQKVGLTWTMEMAEVLAVRRALKFARELCLLDIVLEGNCLRVIQALNSLEHCNTLFGHIVNESKRLGGSIRTYVRLVRNICYVN